MEIGTFLRDNPSGEAVIFANNSLTMTSCGLEAIAQPGRRIPEKLAVSSFDDNDLFRLHSPTITAIAQPVEVSAEALLNVLLAKLQAGQPAGQLVQEIVLPAALVGRSSSLRPR